MSAFLGPIHYWLYNKIELQDKMVDTILTLNREKNYVEALESKVDEACGFIEKKPLEEMIDESNIHGWLQHKVSIVEHRLGFVVSDILKNHPDACEEINKVIYELGIATFRTMDKSLETSEQIYQCLNDMLLDGMPCDHVNELVSSSAEEIIYRRRICIHEAFWSAFEGDVDNYYQIRSKFIEGFLADTAYQFDVDAKGNYHIRKK